ncbi:amino acid permease [Streptomyces tubbatahanensis]|uniref:Amino acid permease n=1 Tax=Streptomyces tubbatahanensis TaxID=2923272 RepID=A0ABY3XMF2_9ACTN|nr:amino acid permease [Streptomyces tubbatahanensis]UNS95570.1 amino acid permease [Streptomyces tubbatahanensis]
MAPSTSQPPAGQPERAPDGTTPHTADRPPDDAVDDDRVRGDGVRDDGVSGDNVRGDGVRGDTGRLAHGLKRRHVTMISIGGVIGAGLFVGSSAAIATAGPAVLVSFVLAAALVVLVMRMLGEMATARPDTGSFSTYADQALGHWAGFAVGWLYWWFYVLVIPIEATAAARILAGWCGGPAWLWALGVTLALTGSNLLSVANYGEFEYWFALVKVVAICAFVALGVLAVLGLLPGDGAAGISHLTSDGGFAPNGWTAVVAALLTAMFSFQGSEVVTIAAAESATPREGVRKAVNAVVWRLGLFYLGSTFVVVCLVPWDAAGLEVGSYQFTLERMHVPAAGPIMDVVVLVAVASCLNSALYTASRMAYSLALRNDAPASWRRVTARGVPRHAILSSTAVGFLAVAGNYFLPQKLFGYLMASSGAIALMMYLTIAVTQLAMRRRTDAAGETPQVRMWLHPWLTLMTIAFIVAVLLIMAVTPGHRLELWLSLTLSAVLVLAGLYVQRRQRRRSGSDPHERAGDRAPGPRARPHARWPDGARGDHPATSPTRSAR